MNEDLKIPTSLKHKPVIVAENYDRVDGKLFDNSDVKGLSCGLAQWNDRGNVDISAKVWRHTGEKWSRQSEEMPLHRVLDLAIFVCETYRYFQNAYKMEKLYDSKNPKVATVGLQGDAMRMKVCTDNPLIDSDIKLFDQILKDEGEILGERFSVLKEVLEEMEY